MRCPTQVVGAAVALWMLVAPAGAARGAQDEGERYEVLRFSRDANQVLVARCPLGAGAGALTVLSRAGKVLADLPLDDPGPVCARGPEAAEAWLREAPPAVTPLLRDFMLVARPRVGALSPRRDRLVLVGEGRQELVVSVVEDGAKREVERARAAARCDGDAYRLSQVAWAPGGRLALVAGARAVASGEGRCTWRPYARALPFPKPAKTPLDPAFAAAQLDAQARRDLVRGDTLAAQRNLNAALALAPGSAAVLWDFARVRARTGDRDGAFGFLSRLKALATKESRTLLKLARKDPDLAPLTRDPRFPRP